MARMNEVEAGNKALPSLSSRILKWSRHTQNHRETPRDNPDTCSYCLGNAPLCSSLCTQCQGFSYIGHVLFCKWGRLRNHEIGPLSAISAMKSCTLCGIISDTILEKWHATQTSTEIESANFTCSLSGPFWPCGQLGTWEPSIKVDSRFHEYRAFYRVIASSAGNRHAVIQTDIHVLLAYPKYSQDSFFCSTWILLPRDLSSMAMMWLDRCKKKHQSLCGTKEKAIIPELPPNFRLIDLKDRCIVSPPENCQYLALSYVWGAPGTTDAWLDKDNISRLRTKGGVDTLQLPRTITEAMDLASQLKFRYLWVDALCIIQHPAGTEQEQLEAMGAIYHLSQMTIVAASGPDANAGLPGFGTHLRSSTVQNDTRQLFESDDPREWYKPNFDTTIPLTVWNSRGWTMQEQLLSQRCLFITQHQIYFQCRCSTLEEDYGHSFERGHLGDATRSYSNPLYDPNIRYKMAAVVAQFTRRQLTYQSDVLNAFAGIASVLNFQAKALLNNDLIRNNITAPIHCTTKWELPDTLSWDWEGSPARRLDVDFPSWHWSAWLGPVDYPLSWGASMLTFSPYMYFPDQGLKKMGFLFDSGGQIDEIHSKEVQRLAQQIPWTLLIQCEYLNQDLFRLELATDIEDKTSISLRDDRSKMSKRMKIMLAGSEELGEGIVDIKDAWRSLVESPTVRLGLIAIRRSEWHLDRPKYVGSGSNVVLIVLLVREDSGGHCSRLGLGELSEDAWIEAKPDIKSIILV